MFGETVYCRAHFEMQQSAALAAAAAAAAAAQSGGSGPPPPTSSTDDTGKFYNVFLANKLSTITSIFIGDVLPPPPPGGGFYPTSPFPGGGGGGGCPPPPTTPGSSSGSFGGTIPPGGPTPPGQDGGPPPGWFSPGPPGSSSGDFPLGPEGTVGPGGEFPYDNNNEPMLKKRRGRKKRKVPEAFAPINGFMEGAFPPGALDGSGQAKTKRARTSFKHHQLRIMKAHFQINQNPDSRELKMLSQKTGLDKKVLQVGRIKKQYVSALCYLLIR